MIADIPNLTKDQLEIAKKGIEKGKVECPTKDGRLHQTYKFASLDDNRDAHYCKTCGKSFESKRREGK